MGATVRAESPLDASGGTRFTVTLGLWPAPQTTTEPART